eukprot:CAMPEP_0202695552 /NCGR_PEP_ID=MMETSP1385-20130828/9126_1 /ASSEMBLY_ACC=CAM_ASM_000861 /TAXON_ID=933848 /ORGANISM="Elphidium margaritaceum" /LENGTH=194 /DNA_ID=CAMNT_0049351601 /DNA_START=197 /DNA_END=777 /DNA_ORIENTATION=-
MGRDMISAYVLVDVGRNFSRDAHANIVSCIHAFMDEKYFVKIYEVLAKQRHRPSRMAREVLKLSSSDAQMQHDLLIPISVRECRQPPHRYEIVQYPYISHVTLERIALGVIEAGKLNTKYYIDNQQLHPWKALSYKLKMLDFGQRIIQIIHDLRRKGYTDVDISPDNFLVRLSKTNKHWSTWDASQCVKIDHES